MLESTQCRNFIRCTTASTADAEPAVAGSHPVVPPLQTLSSDSGGPFGGSAESLRIERPGSSCSAARRGMWFTASPKRSLSASNSSAFPPLVRAVRSLQASGFLRAYNLCLGRSVAPDSLDATLTWPNPSVSSLRGRPDSGHSARAPAYVRERTVLVLPTTRRTFRSNPSDQRRYP